MLTSVRSNSPRNVRPASGNFQDPLGDADPWSGAPSPSSSRLFTGTPPATTPTRPPPFESPIAYPQNTSGYAASSSYIIGELHVGGGTCSPLPDTLFTDERDAPSQYTLLTDSVDTDGSGIISLSSLHRLLKTSRLPPSTVEKIINLVSTATSASITRQQCFVALALTGIAQQGEEPSIERVLQLRPLPTPNLNLASESSTSSDPFRVPAVSTPTVRSPWGHGLQRGISEGVSTNGHAVATAAASEPSDHNSLAPSYFDSNGEARGLYPSTANNMKGWWKDVDQVQITMVLEREGYFAAQKYTVISSKHPEPLSRRYTDFVWLHDCLSKRYPFRLLPNLPPKRVSPDRHFIEHRRRGLKRWLGFVLNHPIFKVDGALSVFMSEPNFEAWRKRNKVSYQDESESRKLDQEAEMSIPADLEDKLEAFKQLLPELLASHTQLVLLAERSLKRLVEASADQSRMAMTLASLGERLPDSCRHRSLDVRSESCTLCKGVGSGLGAVSDALSREGLQSEARSKSLLLGSLEDLKCQRDLYVSARDLFARHEKLSRDSVDTTRKKLEAKQKKLEICRANRKTNWELEEERLTSGIAEDNAAIDKALARRVYIRHAMWHEYSVVFHSRNTSLTTLGWQLYVKDRNQTLKAQIGLYEGLESRLQDMPVD